MIMSTCRSNWSDVHEDLLSEILKRLNPVGFLRCGATCLSWHQFTKDTSPNFKLPWLLCSPKSKLPWLLLSPSSDPDYRLFYNLSENKIYRVHLPDISGHDIIGSSHGFLITVDSDADIHATNPLTGVRLPFPPTSKLFPFIRGALRDPSSNRLLAYLCEDYLNKFCFDEVELIRAYRFAKAALTPSLDAMFINHNSITGYNSFARPQDVSWTPLFRDIKPRLGYCTDFILHKNRIHFITYAGVTIVLDAADPTAAPFFSERGPGFHPYHRYLVESPDGQNLFLVNKHHEPDGDNDDDGGEEAIFPLFFKIFILNNKTTYTWSKVNNVGDIAIFLGLNYSFAVKASDYPCIKGNHIYYAEDCLSLSDYIKPDNFGVTVFNLGDGSQEPLLRSKELKSLINKPPVWFTPSLI